MNYKFYRTKIKDRAEKKIMFSLRPRLLYNQGLISLYFLIVRANSSPLDGGVYVIALAPASIVSKIDSFVGPPVAIMATSGYSFRISATIDAVAAAPDTFKISAPASSLRQDIRVNRSNRRDDRNIDHPLDLRDDLIRDRRVDHYTVSSLMFCLKRQTGRNAFLRSDRRRPRQTPAHPRC